MSLATIEIKAPPQFSRLAVQAGLRNSLSPMIQPAHMPFGIYKPVPSMKPIQAEARPPIVSNLWSPEAPSGQQRANIMLIDIKMRLTSTPQSATKSLPMDQAHGYQRGPANNRLITSLTGKKRTSFRRSEFREEHKDVEQTCVRKIISCDAHIRSFRINLVRSSRKVNSRPKSRSD